MPDSRPESTDLPTQIPYRALQRVIQRVAADVAADVAAQPPVAPAGAPRAPRPPRPSRRTRQQAEERAAWRATKQQILRALADLRAEQVEMVVYQSPDFQRAAMLKPVELSEIPPVSPWRVAGQPAGPFEDDRSDEAERWRAEMRIRAEMILQWRTNRSARQRLRPGNTWRNLGSAGERGGPIPGSKAWPGAWSPYLLRQDPEGPMGSGWMSPLGVAFRRVERDYAGTPLLRALWLYTDPDHYGDMARLSDAMQRSLSRCYAWLDAASLRLSAEMTAVVHGNQAPETRRDRADAEHAEATAWAAPRSGHSVAGADHARRADER